MRTVDSIADELSLPKVDFIKMDVEGAEVDTLRGAVKTLWNNDVRLAIETYHLTNNREQTNKQVTEFLNQLGYKVIVEEEYIYANRSPDCRHRMQGSGR